jgi:hypothetical protein
LDATQPRGELAVHQQIARIGDTIECDVRHPFQHTIRMKLETPAAAAHGNDLLRDPKSGWRLASPPACPVCGEAGCDCPRDVQAVVREMMEGKND